MSSELVDDLINPGRPELISLPNPGERLAKELANLNLPSLTNSFGAILSKTDLEPRSNIEVDPSVLPDISLEEVQALGLKLHADEPSFDTNRNDALSISESSISGDSDEAFETDLASSVTSSVNLPIRTVPDCGVSATDAPGDTQDLSTLLLKQRAAVIGGAIVRDINLVVCRVSNDGLEFYDVPVLPLQVPEEEQAMLFSRMPEHEGDSSESILILPENYTAPPGFAGVDLFSKDVEFGVKSHQAKKNMADHGMEKADLQVYTITGDIVDFWGIKGLTAKLYKYKGVPEDASAKEESADEKVVLNTQSLVFEGQPLGKLFPFIDNDDIANLPIENLELTYSEAKTKNPLHKPGLRLEVDVVLKDSLEWVGDSIKGLFGSSHPPTIHLSALLSETRNWSKPPQIDKLELQGYFKDMSLKPWDLLEFTTMGIEITATKDHGSWYFGFGFIGEVDIIGIPEAQVPLGLSYRLARDPVLSDVKGGKAGRKWDLLLVAEDWKHIFGFENVTMTKAFLEASFYEGHFSSSISLDIGGQIKVGGGTFDVGGRFAKGWANAVTWTWIEGDEDAPPLAQEDYFIQASMGNMTLSDMKKIHAQITGRELAEDGGDMTDDDITFKNMSIKISCAKYKDDKLDKRSLELAGEVTVGDTSTYSASLTFATEGISVTGAVSNVQIPGTDVVIEKAGLRAFLALKTSSSVEKPDTAKPGHDGSKSLVSKGDSAKNETSKRRQSSFEILGVINFHDVIFEAGFYTGKSKKDGERDWLAFGSAKHIRLRDAWPNIPIDSFLNLQLDNVTLIASSKARKRESGDARAIQSKEQEKEDTCNDIHGNWSVLREIDSLDYPIIQGFQICASISSFQQLEELNKNRKIEGLKLYLGYATKGEFTAAVQLPPSFRIEISEHSSLHTLTASIVIDKTGPSLELKATLTINMERSDPIHVTGLLVGRMQGIDGELYMDPDSKWINPFDLHKEIIVANLGVGVGVSYAVGLGRLSFKGQVTVAEYQGNIDAGVDVTKPAAVLRIELNKLDLADIIKIAGRLANEKSLEAAGDNSRGLIVFSDMKLYLSSGAKFMGEYYDRGIQIRGKLNFFDKLAYFDGKFTEDGVSIKGGLDAFKIGGLEVTSLKEYQGKRRATLDIEASKTAQKVLIDGIIRYHDIELQAYINANLQMRYLEADIMVKLADVLQFALKAKIDVKDSDHLENAVVDFEAHLELKILQSIIDGVIEALETLKKMADKTIDDAKADVEKRLGELKSDLAKSERKLAELRVESQKQVLKRRTEIDAENKVLREANAEIDKYERKVREARAEKQENSLKIQEYERRRDEAQARLDKKTGEMHQEYDRQVQEEKAKQDSWKAERQRLEEQRDSSWGDLLRKREPAHASWRYWTRVEDERWEWKKTCESNLANCYFWEKPYWAAKLAEAAIGLEQAHASKAIEAEILHAIEAITNTPEFRAIESGINDAIREVSKFERALERLIEKGPMGYIEEMTRDERRDLQRQIDVIKDLEEKSQELSRQLEAAKKALEETKGRLSPEQEEARKRIVDLEEEIKLAPWEAEYRNKQEDYERIRLLAEGLVQTLEEIKKGIHAGTDLVRQVVEFMKFIPEIRSVTVRASSQTLANHAPLMFEMAISWRDELHTVHVEWTPNQGAPELYSSAAKKLVGLAE